MQADIMKVDCVCVCVLVWKWSLFCFSIHYKNPQSLFPTFVH